MTIQKFIQAIEAEFEEIKPGTLNGETILNEMIAWNSLNALIIMVLVKEFFNVELEVEELDPSITLNELYQRAQQGQSE